MSTVTTDATVIPPPPPPLGAVPAGGYDLGAILGAAFRDPEGLAKFLWGSLAVLFTAVPLIGVIPLLGFQARTLRRGLLGEEHPLADWNDLGAILTDGVRVLGVALIWGLVAGVLGFMVTVPAGGVIAAAASSEEPVLIVFAVLVGVIGLGVVLAGAAAFRVLFALALIRMMAADRFGEAFRVGALFRMLSSHPTPSLYLLGTLILIHILSAFTVLACVVGLIPGMFWAYVTEAVAMARIGRIMGVPTSR